MERKNKKENLNSNLPEGEDEVDELLDKVWENWTSRRRCEQTHKPKYIGKDSQKE
ncbi:MAG: hypothetical protein GF317_07215 [Candidatus Lokiarchaeota archaeon]|nr:hypothetical protein [Candidatus Lokiarchaeota archaeon]MBD3199497.1 hypothetical protein [Candidatus Lokiarchaeota archaeon]